DRRETGGSIWTGEVQEPLRLASFPDRAPTEENFMRPIIRSALAAALFAGLAVVATSGSMSNAQETTTDPTRAGSLDIANFNPPQGFVTTQLGGESQANGIVQQPSGRLVAAGLGGSASMPLTETFVTLLGYNDDGTIDRSFGLNGVGIADVGADPQIGDVMLQGDEGALITLGSTFDNRLFAVRHTANGFLDRNFGTDGRAFVDGEGDLNPVNDGAVQPDGKILALSGTGDFGIGVGTIEVVRFDFDGELDTTFGTDGIATIDNAQAIIGYGLAVQSDGKIVIAGSLEQPAAQGGASLFLTRLNTDGTVDASFGTGGSTTLEVGRTAAGFAILIDASGRIIVGGTGNANDAQEWLVARFDSAGALDTSFASGVGYVTASVPDNPFGQIYDIEFDASGDVVATGQFGQNLVTSQFFVGRFLAEGAVDAAFGVDGVTQTNIGDFAIPERLIVQNDGKIVVAGFANVDGVFQYATARYLGAPSTVVPVDEARLLETRVGPGFTTIDGEQQGIGRRTAGEITEIDIAGRANVPNDAHAAIVNIGAIQPEQAGFVTAFDCDDDVPNSSTLNHPASGVRANSAIVQLGADGSVCVFTQRATDLVVDITAYVNADGDITTFDGRRILETRQGATFVTADGQQQGIGRRAADQVTVVDVAGRVDVPADAIAGIVNVAAINPEQQGFVSIYSCDDTRPNASTLNHLADATTSNGAIIEFDGDGQLCVYTQRATDLVIDVVGYVMPATDVITTDPARLVETRLGSAFQTIDGQQQGIGQRAAGQVTTIPVAGRAAIPTGAVTAIFNVTAINAAADGFVTLYDCDDERPNTSTLNVAAGETIANRAVVALDGDGQVCLYTHRAMDIVIDATGYTT
ncbi:MAG: delta-60 repeat domain-containing protein, partial [Actinomycetota bacterium]